MVKSSAGVPLEGILVQLIAPNSVRTTVYSNEEGRFEFPRLQAGSYTLRIARPLEHLPFRRDSVRIDGATLLEDIVLERVSNSEYLPPTPEILGQLSGAEFLWNFPGTAQEKRAVNNSCGLGCHSYQQIFRSRFDENGWRLIVERMTQYRGAPLIARSGNPRESPEQQELIVKWLTKVRGPDSKDMPLRVFPGPRGVATRVVITEYELPRAMIETHDVAGDSRGNIWFSSHRTPYVGVLDPRTGIVKEYRIPDSTETPDALPGTHRVAVDKNDIVWFSQNWSHTLIRFDPKTEKFTQFQQPHNNTPVNTPGFGNFAVAPDGTIWMLRGGIVNQIDPETGKYLKQFPLQRITGTYDNMISDDGNFWAGGVWPGQTVGLLDLRSGQVWEVDTPSLMSGPARGGFDPEGNAWLGGRGGMLIRLDAKTKRTREFYPPTPYVAFYEAMPDKKGEVWAGDMHSGRFVRFNPRTERWIEYVLPEPYSHDRRTWIDNSTDPVTVWYADYAGYIVRIQPLE
jgi:virginiamycin B lyase